MKLKEFQDKAQQRLTALQENEKAIQAGKPAPHEIKGNAQLKETKAYAQFLQALGGNPEGVPSMDSRPPEFP